MDRASRWPGSECCILRLTVPERLARWSVSSAALGAFWAIGGCIGRDRPLRAPLPPDVFQLAQDYSAGGRWLGSDVGKLPLRRAVCAGHLNYSRKLPIILTSPPGPCALEKPACPRFLRRRLFLTVVSAGRMGRRRVPAAVTGMGGATRVPSPEPAGAQVSGAFRAPGDKRNCR